MKRSVSKQRTLAFLVLACTGALACDSANTPGGSGGGAGASSGAGGGASGSSGTSGTSGATATGGSVSAGGSSSGAAGTSNGSGGSSGTSGGSAGTNAAGGGSGGTSGAGTSGSSGSSGSGATTAGTSGAASGGSGGGGSVFPPSVTRPKIMIVGDSISAGPGCYKKYLVQNLTNDGITNYDFVGEYTDDCGGGVRHSAVSCTTSGNYTQPTFTVPNCTSTTYPGMATLVATHNPDLVMIQLGVNDVWGGTAAVSSILNNYTTLVTQARAHNPNVVVMVAQIHKIITDNCMNAASTTKAEELITAIPGWAEGVSTTESPVLVADLWTNSDAHEADDCVHPNDAGAQRMGLNWFNALKPILQ
jgi:lysophospholipase L1-like esterase